MFWEIIKWGTIIVIIVGSVASILELYVIFCKHRR